MAAEIARGEGTASALRRSESSFAAPDGLTLFRRSWLPDEPRRTLLVVHGFGEHSGRYDELAAWFAARGCAVHAYDQRGHGRSGGPRTHVDRFEQFLDDLAAFHALVRDEHPATPILLVAHSMGGLIGLAYLALRKPVLSGAVISGPALAPDRAVPRAKVVLAHLLRRVAPRLAMKAGLDVDGLSRDPEVVRRYLADPLVIRTMTTSLAAEMMGTAAALRGRAPQITTPVLLMHGAQDPLCPVAASEEFAAGLTSAGSAFRSYPTLRHEIFNEPDREAVYADAWRWIEETLG
ncbi:MAG TPA: alpha/beta hydrolase [Myxococcota bacterium]|nr:alpha/beta hydrolase [Myxococcota bacterium]